MAFLKRWCLSLVNYGKMVGNDYATVIGELIKNAKEKPISATVKIAPLGVAVYAYKTNQTERDMLNLLVEKRHQLVLLPNSIHSEKADEEISSRTLYLDQKRLKLINCILFSILVRLPDGNDVCLYENRDPNLKRWWWQRYDDIVDACIFGRWFRLRKSFENYDTNDKELQSAQLLPEV